MSANNGTQGIQRSQGYVNLHREIREHWLWEDPVKFQWWVDILMECNYTDRKVSIGFQVMDCKRGESLNSLKTWGKRWRVDTGKVRRFFKMLEDEGMIVLENERLTTRLKVCNYDTYNKLQHGNDTQTTRRRHGNDTQTNTNKQDKQVKQGEIPLPPPTSYGPPTNSEVAIPELDEVRRVFRQHGGTDEMAEKFRNKYAATGWRSNNSPIKNFIYLVPGFIEKYRQYEGKAAVMSGGAEVDQDDPNSFI